MNLNAFIDFNEENINRIFYSLKFRFIFSSMIAKNIVVISFNTITQPL